MQQSPQEVEAIKRVVTLSFEREVTVMQRVTHTTVAPVSATNDMIRDQALHEIEDCEWHDQEATKSTEPVLIDFHEATVRIPNRA